MVRKLRPIDAWDGHDLLLDPRHYASSHATTNAIRARLAGGSQ